MKINKLISSIIAGSALLAAGTVNAAGISGDVVQMSTNGVVVTVWVKPANFTAVPTYVWSVTTNNLVIAATLGSALHKSVQMTTSANCATTGAVRACGAISAVTVN
jgi:hypothetical protein